MYVHVNEHQCVSVLHRSVCLNACVSLNGKPCTYVCWIDLHPDTGFLLYTSIHYALSHLLFTYVRISPPFPPSPPSPPPMMHPHHTHTHTHRQELQAAVRAVGTAGEYLLHVCEVPVLDLSTQVGTEVAV